MPKTIIDVSEWQGKIDWEKAKPHIDCAILRMGYAEDKASYDDKYWSRNVSECERLGIPWGAYLYSYATTQTELMSEVAHALRLLHGTSPQLAVYFDSEQKGTEKVAAGFAAQFCAAMRSAGYMNGVYASLSWWNTYMKGKVDPDNLWVAAYGSNDGRAHTRPNVGEGMWQYTSKGKVAGISGDVDMSHLYEEPKGVKMTRLTRAEVIAQVAEHFARHDSHGYSQPNRGKGGTETIRLSDGRTGIISSGDVDCSEMVRQCVNVAFSGKHTGPISYMWTGDEDAKLKAQGFTRYSYDKAKVKRGDVLWVKGHTGIALGGGYQADAHGDENGGITGPKAGDQTGHEVEIRPLRSWTYIYRVPEAKVVPTQPESKRTNDFGLAYRAHVQTAGWLPVVHDGQVAGTVGQSCRMEALKITPPPGVILDVNVHMQGKGWVSYPGVERGKHDPVMGTTGEGRRLEAFQIHARKIPEGKRLLYRAHVQGKGWLPWVGDGKVAGTTGESRRLEAIQMKIVD